jgi:uroporphyrinogen decarboxylase
MTKLQEFNKLITNGEASEKIIFRPILMQFAAEYIGSNYGKFASDYKVLAEANLRCMEDFDTDMLGLISDPYRETSAFGAKVKFIETGVPRCEEHIVKSIDDIKNLKRPDVTKAERTLDRIKAAELLSKQTQGNVPIIGWVEGALAEACDLAGMDTMLMNLMMDPDFANLLMDKCLQTAKDFAKAQLEAGCHVIGIGDAVCSQIDTMTYDTFVRERHQELISYIHELGGKVKLHICGDTNHLLPHYTNLNLDILDLDWQVDIAHAREILGDKVILCGNLDPTIIMSKSEDEVYQLSKEIVDKYKNQRIILSGGCEISALTPYENLRAMSKASNN